MAVTMTITPVTMKAHAGAPVFTTVLRGGAESEPTNAVEDSSGATSMATSPVVAMVRREVFCLGWDCVMGRNRGV